MEQRNREMHEQVIHIEKDKHNLDKSCPICNEEVRIRKERFQKIKDERARVAREKVLKRLGNIAGDPLVTASKREESINTFKDMYGIFKVKAPK